MANDKSSRSAISYIPHILFIVAQVYCGIFVIFLMGPPVYAILTSYKLGIITINFSILLSSFHIWWGKFLGLTTGKIILIMFSCFPIGFIFAEAFYRFATLKIPPLLIKRIPRKGTVAKNDFKNNNLVKLLLDKKIINEHKDATRVYFDHFIKNKEQLRKRLEQIAISKIEIERVLTIWRPPHKIRIPLLNSPFQYMPDINLENLEEEITDSSETEQFRVKCYIQRDISLQRVWDWENFQSSFCLYLEGTLLVFDFLFGLSISYTLIYILIWGSALKIFWMVICLAILFFSMFLTWLMKIARTRKFKAFQHAHKAIEKILEEEKTKVG